MGEGHSRLGRAGRLSTDAVPADNAAVADDREAGADPLRTIVEQLEMSIVFGRRLPRERLVEEELAQEFATTRHIVRQALVELERIGVVDRIRNRGATVRDFKPDDVRKIFAVREILERAAAAQIDLPADRDTVAHLVEIQAQHDNAVERADVLRAFRVNLEFHYTLFSACRNQYLLEAIQHYGQRTHAIRSFSIAKPEYLRRARDEHRAMIRALKGSDRQKLVDLCGNHLDISKSAYIEAYRARFPE